MADFEITAKKWNAPIRVAARIGSVTERSRLRNWYLIDKGMEDSDNFTWGYAGTGAVCTAYSIVREFLGKESAEALSDRFLAEFVERLDGKKGFVVTGEEICESLGMDPKLAK